MSCADVRSLLERHGVLLLQDKKLPSVAGTIAGQTLSASWWSHPRAQEIFQCLGQLEDEALATRLIGGKVTWVHKRLWPELIAVGESNAPWQTDRLSAPARRLLRSLQSPLSSPAQRAGAKELQQRLLVVASEVHTESGRHELQLTSWQDWAGRVGVRPHPSSGEALKRLEAAARSLGAPLSLLPWAS
ncbi:MAG: hypothetical protein ACXW2F_02835 [Thermoanaerobaculia bacterium]